MRRTPALAIFLDLVPLLATLGIWWLLGKEPAHRSFYLPGGVILESRRLQLTLICFTAAWQFVRIHPTGRRLTKRPCREEIAVSLLHPRAYLKSQFSGSFLRLQCGTVALVMLLAFGNAPLLLPVAISMAAFSWSLTFHLMARSCDPLPAFPQWIPGAILSALGYFFFGPATALLLGYAICQTYGELEGVTDLTDRWAISLGFVYWLWLAIIQVIGCLLIAWARWRQAWISYAEFESEQMVPPASPASTVAHRKGL